MTGANPRGNLRTTMSLSKAFKGAALTFGAYCLGKIAMTQARVIDPEIYGEGADALGHDAMLELSLNMADTALSDLEKLIEADGDEAHRLLHGLKGAASSCGATRLATMAEQKMRSLPLSPADVDELRRIVSLTRDAYSAMIEG